MKATLTRGGWSRKKTIIAAGAGVVVIIIIVAIAARRGKGNYQFAAVTRGNITQVVSVTGNTTPVQSLDLSFPAGGTIVAVDKQAGDAVRTGDVLAKLNTNALAAQRAQAQAQVDAAQANLAALQAGATPQSVQVSQAAVATAEQTLANTYANVPSGITDAYAKAVDAVENQIATVYNDPESNSPRLAFTVSDSQVYNNANAERLEVTTELAEWQREVNNAPTSTSASATSTLDLYLTHAAAHLAAITTMLNTDAQAIINAGGLSASSTATYKTDITNAVTEVSGASSDVSTLQQNIAAEEASVAQAAASLNETLAGSTAQAIAAQQAQVEQAQASVQNIDVQIANATLSSPINGVVTVQNAKVGQVAVAGQTITSIISADNFEVDSYVPETDIGKVAVGNPVDMTFDAFPGETFKGTVFYIDPAETIQSGVVDYLVKASFDNLDPRIKSGLTANLTIKTQTHNNVLILPQYAVIQNVSGTYVDVLQNGKETQMPVTLGIRDQNGNVEVISGVNEGEQVINVGLKSQ